MERTRLLMNTMASAQASTFSRARKRRATRSRQQNRDCRRPPRQPQWLRPTVWDARVAQAPHEPHQRHKHGFSRKRGIYTARRKRVS